MAEQKKTKVVDKWKTKTWYTLVAPDIFEGKEIGTTVATDEKVLKNRRIKIGLGEITGSFTQTNAFTTVHFRVGEIKGKTAYTKFIGHELASGYIKTLLRRRRSIVYQVDDVATKDGKQVRMKTVGVTAYRVSEHVRKDLRRAISTEVKAHAKELEFSQLVQEIVFGKVSNRVFTKIKRITPMRRFEVRKSEVMETL